MKILEKDIAVDLRKKGKTFSEILRQIPVSKGSLSYWLRDIKLTSEQLARIKYKNDRIKSQFIKFNELKSKEAENNRKALASNAAEEIRSLSERELKLVGIALYWAEGYKRCRWTSVSFTNSDPEMIRLIMKWFRTVCEVPEYKFRIRIQCHGVRKSHESRKYWSEVTGIPLSQFTKAYIRVSPTSKRRAAPLCPYGICDIRISDINLLTRIKGWIQGLTALSSSPV